jgi:hypothetical protein
VPAMRRDTGGHGGTPPAPADRMQPRFPVVLLVAAWLAAACTSALVPAPGTVGVGGVGKGAAAEDAAVRIVARAQAWRGDPADLRGVVTPLLVTIDNGSGRPLGVRYDRFTLEAPDGRTFAAIPPFDIEATVTEPVAYTASPAGGFLVAPYLSPYYPWMPVFNGPFLHDGWYYSRHRPVFRRIDLPTGDMVRKALPEGVVEPGGRVSGFLYLEDVRDVEGVSFVARLVDARSDQLFGTVRIPFVVD